MNKNIVLCGVGGQGTVLASKLIASAAMNQGIPIMSAETIGMAQRGGSVFSHLRMGENLHTPMLAKGEADLIIGFEPGETVRMLPYLRSDGQVVTSSRIIMPITATLSDVSYNADTMIQYLQKHVRNLLIIDTDAALQDIGSSKVLNVLLLGAAAYSGALGLTEEDLENAIRNCLPERFHALNLQAVSYARRTHIERS